MEISKVVGSFPVVVEQSILEMAAARITGMVGAFTRNPHLILITTPYGIKVVNRYNGDLVFRLFQHYACVAGYVGGSTVAVICCDSNTVSDFINVQLT